MRWDDIDRWNYQMWGAIAVVAVCVGVVWGGVVIVGWFVEEPRRLWWLAISVVVSSAYFAGTRPDRLDEQEMHDDTEPYP